MPNRDHDDTPYNRNEGRFETSRYDRDEERSPYQREGGYRSSRDWEQRGDWRSGDQARSYAEGYNPARDENAYRGGSRFEEQPRFYGDQPRYYGEQPRYGVGEQPRSARGYDTRSWDDDERWRQRLRGQASGPSGGSGYGTWGGNDVNRAYTRDWDRDYRGDMDRPHGFSRTQDEGDFGEQVRHAGRQVINKVKRAFRGPRGYKRSDERIREDVNDRLALQDELDPTDIEVRVENGDVTLTGSVRNRHEKFRAEEIADDVGGVNEVHNQLRIGSPAPQQTSTSTTPSTTVSRNGRA